MSQAERVYAHLQHFPEAVVAEVADFVEFPKRQRHRLKESDTGTLGVVLAPHLPAANGLS